jgi:hypothetical protein
MTVAMKAFGYVFLFLAVYGALVVAFEKKLVYYPIRFPDGEWNPGAYGLIAEDVEFRAADGVRLHGWYFSAVPDGVPGGARATWVWFHGNAGNITHRLDNIQKLLPLRIDVFIFDYRGYGKSAGQPDEAGLYLDSQAAYDYVVREKSVRPERVILFGRSLGTACAVAVAAQNPAGGLILESAFTSAGDMAQRLFPFLPLRHVIRSRFDSLARIPHIKIPKLFLHGTEDATVPYELGRRLYDAALEPREFYPIPGADHNDTYIVGGAPYFAALDRFITRSVPPEIKKS